VTPEPIEPDTKDWTWVLTRPCPECGFEAGVVTRAELATLIRENAEAWEEFYNGHQSGFGERPQPDIWSPLEYACHIRDVYRIYDYRLDLILSTDDPTYPNWDQDKTAIDERYDEQDAAAVADELQAAADQIASRFAAVHGDQWSRTGNRSDGARFTVDTFARYLLHDVVHHIYDVSES